MAVISEFPLRDFDGQSDTSDSETELLIQRVSSQGKNHVFYRPLQKVFGSTRNNNNNTNSGGSGNSVHYKWSGRHDNSTRYEQQRQPSNFLSQLFGVVGGGTSHARFNSARLITESSNRLSSSSSTSTSILLETRNTGGVNSSSNNPSIEQSQSPLSSRDDPAYRTACSNLSSYTVEEERNDAWSVTQAPRFGHRSRTYHVNSPPATTSTPMDVPDASPMGTFNYNSPNNNNTSDASAGSQASANTFAPTETANSVIQTVIDPENGSKTIFYQHNRRKSKRRSIASICKMCFCR